MEQIMEKQKATDTRLKKVVVTFIIGMLVGIGSGSVRYIASILEFNKSYEFLFWIVGGFLLVAGMYRAIHHVFGYTWTTLFGDPENELDFGIFPVSFLQAGVFSIAILFIQNAFSLKNELSLVTLLGVGGITSLVRISLRKITKNFFNHLIVFLSNVLIGALGGWATGGPVSVVIAGILGGGPVGLVEIGRNRKYPSESMVSIFPFWITAWISGMSIVGGILWMEWMEPFSVGKGITFLIIWGIIFLIIWGGMRIIAVLFDNLVIPLLFGVRGFTLSFIMPLCILLKRFSTMLCNHCLRYTSPFRSTYIQGIRYCEHCYKEVEYTSDPGKIILVFGNNLPKLKDRVFILVNPDFEQETEPLEISEVYLDPITCNKRLVERFVTYILNHPLTSGLQSIRILYTGALDDLGENLRNTLRNNFVHIEKLPQDYQQELSAKTPFIFCSAYQQHVYWPYQNQCPWCERSSIFAEKSPETGTPASLQIRYLVRGVDLLINLCVLLFLLVTFASSRVGILVFMFPFLFPAIFIMFETILLSTWGTTPGRWLFNITVTDNKGNILAFSHALTSAFTVWRRSGDVLKWDNEIYTSTSRKAGFLEVCALVVGLLCYTGVHDAFWKYICIRQLGSINKHVKVHAIKMLGQIDTIPIESLITALNDINYEVQVEAAKTLGQIGDPRAVEPLIAVLNDTNWDIIQAAIAKALGQIGDPRAVEPLITTLKNSLKNSCCRIPKDVVEALGQIGDPRAVESLITALKDKDSDVRVAAAQALGRIGDFQAVGPLSAALTDDNPSVRKAAGEALDKIKKE